MSGRVIVVGSVNVDLVVTAERLPAPGETVIGGRFERHHGGKGGNQAVAAARLGADVTFIGAVGRDAFGDDASTALEAEGIDLGGLVTLDEATGVALILVDATARTASRSPAARTWPSIRSRSGGRSSGCRSDRATSCSSGTRSGPAPRTRRFAWAGSPARPRSSTRRRRPASGPPTLELADILTPNGGELETLAGPGSPSAAAKRCSGSGKRAVLVSLGADGRAAGRRPARDAIRAPHVEAVDTVGAGDTLNGALAAGLAAGLDLAAAAHRAVVAASLAVTRAGAREGMPTRPPWTPPRTRPHPRATSASPSTQAVGHARPPSSPGPRRRSPTRLPAHAREPRSRWRARRRRTASSTTPRPRRDRTRTRSPHGARPRPARRSAGRAGGGPCGRHGPTTGGGPRTSPPRRYRGRSRRAGRPRRPDLDPDEPRVPIGSRAVGDQVAAASSR